MQQNVMKMTLTPVGDCVNVLRLENIGYSDIEYVEAWLHACSIPPSEMPHICDLIMKEGRYDFCNIECRVAVECRA